MAQRQALGERPEGRRFPIPHRATVLRTERITPHMVRVVFGGPGMDRFTSGDFTDHYVKLLFLTPGVTYPEPFDLAVVRERMPREHWPRTRTYTVRAWNPQTRELTVDFVVHGQQGLAGTWAATAAPGTEILLNGPGGAYTPSTGADWHLLAGDESALPAIAAALPRVPVGVPVYAFVEVAGPREEQNLDAPGGVEVQWLHRGDRPVGAPLVEAVTAFKIPTGTGHVFVHGEAGAVKTLRRALRVERGLPMEWLSISGYWRAGHDEDRWQAGKQKWNSQVEAEEQQALTS
ncbi:siderophore-interacting protein [Frankia sp. Mgl5]|uniref:siderophore-interacting protein n=1 Tax=Frankia sp. Mgl5 TaxID=2933793 RepID=UPI00200EB42E|nr:siderophore-interacting protein [Frankia sp. Mgl5]MCK9930644.1 siderophore-interacting protein [Frankia sp. Mgl5]